MLNFCVRKTSCNTGFILSKGYNLFSTLVKYKVENVKQVMHQSFDLNNKFAQVITTINLASGLPKILITEYPLPSIPSGLFALHSRIMDGLIAVQEQYPESSVTAVVVDHIQDMHYQVIQNIAESAASDMPPVVEPAGLLDIFSELYHKFV